MDSVSWILARNPSGPNPSTENMENFFEIQNSAWKVNKVISLWNILCDFASIISALCIITAKCTTSTNIEDFKLIKIISRKHAWQICCVQKTFSSSIFGEFFDNCIKLKVWAQAPVTLVFFVVYSRTARLDVFDGRVIQRNATW